MLHADGDELRRGIETIQDELGVTPEFPPEVAGGGRGGRREPRLPDLDRTDIPFVTIDPDGAMDLDQAMHLERDGDGYLVHYAIADVAAFVSPGDPVDVEAHRRGETLYGADSKVPLHPPVLSEGAASLLPDQVRPALLWTIKVDATGEGTDVDVRRALVRSRAKLDYDGRAAAARRRHGRRDVRRCCARSASCGCKREAARGGVSLPLPEQEIDIDGDRWSLQFRRMLPVEEWNAQISLLTGMAAASLMVYARVGLLRTLPPPDPRDVQRLHRTAKALRSSGPPSCSTPTSSARSTRREPNHAAMVLACTRLLRGSGYVGFDGEVPAQPEHSALASEYAHVTAPLRRLVDRYAGEVCVALCAGEEVPGWVHGEAARAAGDDAGVRRSGRAPTRAPSSTWSRRRCCTSTSADLPRRGGGASTTRTPTRGSRGDPGAGGRGSVDLGAAAAARHRRRGHPRRGRPGPPYRPVRALADR